jgi:aldehyde dehydrogenase (NAD+)
VHPHGERIDAGQVAVNGGPLSIETPLGGYRTVVRSQKGIEALDDYTQIKAIAVASADVPPHGLRSAPPNPTPPRRYRT